MPGRVSLVLALLPVLAGCGYGPPPRTDAGSPAYKADYAACDASATEAVDKNNAKRALSWFASPATRWGRIEDGMNGCMAGKGWGRVRACTTEELRAGNGAGGLVVTARGVQCMDPGRRSVS